LTYSFFKSIVNKNKKTHDYLLIQGNSTFALNDNFKMKISIINKRIGIITTKSHNEDGKEVYPIRNQNTYALIPPKINRKINAKIKLSLIADFFPLSNRRHFLKDNPPKSNKTTVIMNKYTKQGPYKPVIGPDSPMTKFLISEPAKKSAEIIKRIPKINHNQDNLENILDISSICIPSHAINHVFNINIFGGKKKTSDYLFIKIAPKSDSFSQLRLLQLGQTNIVISNPLVNSLGSIKSVSQRLQWFIVIIDFSPLLSYNIGHFWFKYFPMMEILPFGGFQKGEKQGL